MSELEKRNHISLSRKHQYIRIRRPLLTSLGEKEICVTICSKIVIIIIYLLDRKV